MKLKNASIEPKVYFGLHMVEGVAEYRPSDSEAFRIFIGEQTIKNMDSTFQGKPLFVHHVDEVNLATLEQEADGYVIRSFFNKADGKHWCEFIVVTDKGHEAISKGWKLSNAYVMKNSAQGGKWHGVEYQKEITEGEYEHLAIVPNPRYDESIILTPEQFKSYNQQKEAELFKLANSSDKKKGTKGMFNLFKREKVENTGDIESMSVVLPKTKKEMTISQLINEMDLIEEKKENTESVYADVKHLVKVGDKEMTVNELMEEYQNMCKNQEEEKEEESEKEIHVDIDSHKENKDESKESPEEEKEEEKAKNSSDEHFEKLLNAEKTTESNFVVETSADQVARGKNRYGSIK